MDKFDSPFDFESDYYDESTKTVNAPTYGWSNKLNNDPEHLKQVLKGLKGYRKSKDKRKGK